MLPKLSCTKDKERGFTLIELLIVIAIIGQYVRNWWRWVNTGVEICVVNKVR